MVQSIYSLDLFFLQVDHAFAFSSDISLVLVARKFINRIIVWSFSVSASYVDCAVSRLSLNSVSKDSLKSCVLLLVVPDVVSDLVFSRDVVCLRDVVSVHLQIAQNFQFHQLVS